MKGLTQFLVVMLVCLAGRTSADEGRPIFISCGANSSSMVNGRRWDSDSSNGGFGGGRNLTLSSLGIAASNRFVDIDSVYPTLYRTARIFDRPSNYTFKENGANHSYYLRLHFCPFSFEHYLANESSFDIIANGVTLVSGFNPIVESSSRSSKNTSVLIKEYFLTPTADSFVVQFIPIKGSFAFISAMELIPVPDNLFVDYVPKVGSKGTSSFMNLKQRGMETMYRLNVGGPIVAADEDSSIWRTWETDSQYMIMADAGLGISDHSIVNYSSSNVTLFAPLLVYETARSMSNAEVSEKRFNMSWKFKVDPGFDYLVRLHFCELEYEKPNQRIFRIYINNVTAADNFDIVKQAGGKGKPYHIEFFDALSVRIGTLWVQLGTNPAAGAARSDALLNGLEIFKLSRSRNLAAGFSRNELDPRSSGRRTNLILWAGIGAVIVCLVILALILICFLLKLRTKRLKSTKKGQFTATVFTNTNGHSTTEIQNQNETMSSHRGSGMVFSLAEIRTATSDFDEHLVIGFGGFGKVYKGRAEDGTPLAIKRANPQSQQGLREFETEIQMLSKVRHRHLVAMIGFCDEKNEMILVYEHMANGTLRSHLFGNDLTPLSWKQRLEICIGAARGLHYLHTGADGGIIHRDVKTTNILLDENFVGKMSDFGLSKTAPALDQTHVSTAVKGSFGYLDPEYFRRQQLTEKSDVYSFGIVLLEVICARAIINPTLPKEQINLTEWALKWQKRKSLEAIIDPWLKGKCCPESVNKFGEIAEKCVADEGKSRPTMGEVLWHLEYVLQLHKAWLQMNVKSNDENLPRSIREVGEPSAKRTEENAAEESA